MNVLTFGGSRNIGYYASLRLLRQGATVTFLLRSTGVFDSDQDMRPFIAQGKAILVEGDALKLDDVKAAWNRALTANESHAIDLVLFTIGGNPSFKLLNHGFVIKPRNLCTQTLLNVICTVPDLPTSPKFIAVTSLGITQDCHDHLPLALKPLYSFLLAGPHADKLGAERVLAHCSGHTWSDPEPRSDIMNGPSGNWSDRDHLPAKGTLKDLVIVRAAMLMDGECKGDEKAGAYRASTQYLEGAYRVSRKDVAHFISTRVIQNWSEWNGKIANIAY